MSTTDFVIIPIDSNDPDYSVDIVLDNTLYRFYIKWNPRGQFWTISIYTSDDIAIVTGVKIVSNISLFAKFTNPLLPLNNIWAVDITESGLEPTRDNLGTDILIMYEVITDE